MRNEYFVKDFCLFGVTEYKYRDEIKKLLKIVDDGGVVRLSFDQSTWCNKTIAMLVKELDDSHFPKASKYKYRIYAEYDYDKAEKLLKDNGDNADAFELRMVITKGDE